MGSRFKEIIHYATLAPSGHNTQPWKFSVTDDSVRIYPDYSRRLEVVDPDDHALFISLGCALENLIIAANHMGYRVRVECFPPEDDECIQAHLTEGQADVDPDLFPAIPNRQSTRRKYDGRPIPAGDMEKLKLAAVQQGTSLLLLTEKEAIEPIITNDKESWVHLGRSFQRFSLKATALDIKHAHMNMPCEEVEVRTKLQSHLGLETGHPLLLLRVGYADPMPRSYRRPVDDVLLEARE